MIFLRINSTVKTVKNKRKIPVKFKLKSLGTTQRLQFSLVHSHPRIARKEVGAYTQLQAVSYVKLYITENMQSVTIGRIGVH